MIYYAIMLKNTNIVYTVVAVQENIPCNLEPEVYDAILLQEKEPCMSGWIYSENKTPRFEPPIEN